MHGCGRKLFGVGAVGVLIFAGVAVGIGTATAAPVQPTTDGLVSRWSFDDDPTGTTAADAGPGGNTLTLHGNAAFGGTGPDIGVANPGTLAINGTGYATGPSNLLTGAQDFTMTVWVNLPAPLQSTGADLMSIDGKALIGDNEAISGRLSYGASGPSGGRTVYDRAAVAGWHLLAFTYDAAGITAYEDGAVVNSLPGHAALNPGSGITFGDRARPLVVSFDDARIYDRGLSAQEVRGLAFSCANVSQIPRAECQALVDLYLSADSTHWTNSTGWLATNTPCSWFGVGCDNGHVILLGLPGNHLAGPIPASLGDLHSLIALGLNGNQLTGSIPDSLTGLTALQTLSLRENALSGGVPSNIGSMAALVALNLADNQLIGDVPLGITGLAHLTSLDVTYNGVYPTDLSVRAFFSSFNAAWLASQTIPPFDVHTTGVTATGATLTWTPIPYTGDGGYYEVLAVDPTTNTSTPAGRTADKTATGLTVTGLSPGPAYDFVVRTVTPPHGTQQNTVTSQNSDPATPAPTVPEAPTITSTTPGDGAVTVAFSTPSDGGSTITGYTVTTSPGGGTTDGTASPITVSGLTNGTPYTFTVHATNAVGSGPESTASAPVLPHPATTTVTTQDTSLALTWGTWSGVAASAASGGTYRVSHTAGASSTLDFSGTSVSWLAQKGPDRGLARVTVDGVSKGIVDQYAATAGTASFPFRRLSNGAHRLTITVLGAKRPAATAANVTVDGFLVGTSTTPVQETSSKVAFDSWTLTTTSGPSAGSYRGSGATGATATFTFTGTRVDWITADGPDFGRAAVSIDGGPAVTVDLYRRTAAWQVVGRSVTGLAPGTHTITVRALGTRNRSSHGTRIAVDAFRVTG